MSFVTPANFFVVFIALIVVFFLLGFILGSLSNRSKNAAKDKALDASKPKSEESRQTDTLGQDSKNNIDNQNLGQNQASKDYRNRYYNTYW